MPVADYVTEINSLAEFSDEVKAGHLKSLEGVTSGAVNAKDLDYISSAGLRVMLMMYKALNGNLKMEQADPAVKEILAMTGFEEFLL